MPPFVPLFSNPHLQTVAAHLWPRGLNPKQYPIRRRLYITEADTRVLIEEQQPAGPPRGRLVLVHGLESSSRAGCMRGLARAALEAGFATHRMNLRSCGGTEALCRTAYHSGLTTDLEAVARALPAPVFLAGFSLGGNVALKLAGELGEAARGLLAGVCAVSAPIDLAASTRRLAEPRNRLYEARLLRSLKRRIRRRHALAPQRFPLDGLDAVRSLREFDDRFTAPAFGFRGAAEYYATQSAARFLDRIRVPVLLLQAKDDPVIPFEIFKHLPANPHLELVATEHGGHVGFLSRGRPRFWTDAIIVGWMRGVVERRLPPG